VVQGLAKHGWVMMQTSNRCPRCTEKCLALALLGSLALKANEALGNSSRVVDSIPPAIGAGLEVHRFFRWSFFAAITS
jgi:hypothetical protein